jgi:acyl-homoserine-lactone acylase
MVAALAACVVLSLVAAACSPDDKADPDQDPPATVVDDGGYVATVVRTAHDIPHITAADIGSLGFGQGWAVAADRGCELADQILKVRGERARWHGAGDGDVHLASDITYRSWDLRARATELWPTLSDDARAMVQGYADGFNLWLSDNGADSLPGWCSGAPWIAPVDALDLVAYHHDLSMVASGRMLVGAVAAAQPPAAAPEPAAGTPGLVAANGSALASPDPAGPVVVPTMGDVGGTAWALGRAATGSTTSVLGSATQFPWDGELALWENHLTLTSPDGNGWAVATTAPAGATGTSAGSSASTSTSAGASARSAPRPLLDVYGFSLVGLPGVFSGFTADVAWTQVPSGGQRLTYATVDLVDGDPTSYRFGDATRSMTAVPVEVEVLGDDGTLTTVQRTVWTTVHGPVVALPGMAWGTDRAFAYRDAAVARPAMVDHFLGMNRARSLTDIDDVHATVGATGWTATVAVSASGWAWVGDPSATPAVSDGALVGALALAATDPVAGQVAAQGAVMLAGSDPASLWQQVDGAVAPGVVPWSQQPKVQRRDWVVATGDTHWRPNDTVVLSGFSPLVGTEGAPLTPRARYSLTAVADMVALAQLDDRTLGGGDIRAVLLENRGLVSGLLLEQVAERCRAADVVQVGARVAADGTLLWEPQQVAMTPICNLLDRWLGTWNPEDQAPALWNEFLAAFEPAELRGAGRLFADNVDPAKPIDTPATLAPAPATGADPVLVALAEASLTLTAAGFDIDDFWREQQFSDRGGERTPVHGGTGLDGNAVIGRFIGPGSPARTSLVPQVDVPERLSARSSLRRGGWPVNAGTSAVMVVEFTPTGVFAEALLIHGQSGDPDSAFHLDQAYRYSDKAWRPVVFAPADIQAAADTAVVVTGPRGA